MTPEERRLITGLFDRMRDFGSPDKDRDAETLINQSVRAMPDAPYMLVQSVLVQEQALEAANRRVQELEEQVRAMEDSGPARSQSSGSFLGGLFGGGRPAAPSDGRPSSVPQIGGRAPPPSYGGSAWSQPPPQQQPGPAPAAGGGFMRSALTTAAGVAGGMLVAESIRNMMGGAHAHTGSGANSNTTTTEQTEYFDEKENDPGNYDAGGDFGGGDTEI